MAVKLEDRTDLIKFLRDYALVLELEGEEQGKRMLDGWAAELETVAVVDKVYAVAIHGRDYDNYTMTRRLDDGIVYASEEAARAAYPKVKWDTDVVRNKWGHFDYDDTYTIEEVDVIGHGDEEDK